MSGVSHRVTSSGEMDKSVWDGWGRSGLSSVPGPTDVGVARDQTETTLRDLGGASCFVDVSGSGGGWRASDVLPRSERRPTREKTSSLHYLSY